MTKSDGLQRMWELFRVWCDADPPIDGHPLFEAAFDDAYAALADELDAEYGPGLTDDELGQIVREWSIAAAVDASPRATPTAEQAAAGIRLWVACRTGVLEQAVFERLTAQWQEFGE